MINLLRPPGAYTEKARIFFKAFYDLMTFIILLFQLMLIHGMYSGGV